MPQFQSKFLLDERWAGESFKTPCSQTKVCDFHLHCACNRFAVEWKCTLPVFDGPSNGFEQARCLMLMWFNCPFNQVTPAIIFSRECSNVANLHRVLISFCCSLQHNGMRLVQVIHVIFVGWNCSHNGPIVETLGHGPQGAVLGAGMPVLFSWVILKVVPRDCSCALQVWHPQGMRRMARRPTPSSGSAQTSHAWTKSHSICPF
jgi:hypothetical protein